MRMGDSGHKNKGMGWGALPVKTRKSSLLPLSFGTGCPERLLNIFRRFLGSDWTKPRQICSEFRAEPGLNGTLYYVTT